MPTSNDSSSGKPLLHVLRQAKNHIDGQPLPPQGAMLRGRQLRSNNFRTASRIIEHLIFEQIAWEAVRRGAEDDESFKAIEKEIIAEVFTVGEVERLHGSG